VEGARLRTGRNDGANYRVQITQNVSGSNAHNVEPFVEQKLISKMILASLPCDSVRFSINLNNESALQTREIGSHAANRKLPPEF
jgi:hypothetical protein